MSEPLLPVPPPEPNSNWDPMPARCGECGEILNERGDGTGWCQFHGVVKAVYTKHRGSCRRFYAEGVCTCGAGDD